MSGLAVPYSGPPRPRVRVEIIETGWAPWGQWAKKHHYLDSGPLPFSTAFTGFDLGSGDPVAFVGVTGMAIGRLRVARACRLVVHPEWQGAGIGIRFLNTLCQRELEGIGFIGAPVPTYFHTAHPGLVAGLRRSDAWHQVSQNLVSFRTSKPPKGVSREKWFGGHWRSVAGFKYVGVKAIPAPREG